MRDFQRNKIYKWEWATLPQYDRVRIPYDQAQPIVNYIWKQENLKYPPRIKALSDSATKILAGARYDGKKLNVWLKKSRPTRGFIMLHEIAHLIVMKQTGSQIGIHDEQFLGIYMGLLNRHLCIPMMHLMVSANNHELKYDLSAKPIDKPKKKVEAKA